jgi:hypothetical protein
MSPSRLQLTSYDGLLARLLAVDENPKVRPVMYLADAARQLSV